MEVKDIILISGRKVGIRTQEQLARLIGMDKSTLCRKLKKPETMTVFELSQITRVTKMAEGERLDLIKEVERRTK